jgi:hypothetical protein
VLLYPIWYGLELTIISAGTSAVRNDPRLQYTYWAPSAAVSRHGTSDIKVNSSGLCPIQVRH